MQKKSVPGLWQSFVWLALALTAISCSNDVDFTSRQSRKVEAPEAATASESADALAEDPASSPQDEDEDENLLDDLNETSTGAVSETDESVELSLQQFNRMTWDFPCSSDGESGGRRVGEGVEMSGHGTYFFDPFELQGADLILKGEVCPPEKIKRDIVFVIDVSGSMGTNDPVVNGSCGRLNAVQEVIKRNPGDGSAAFGVVTFDGLVQKKSTAFSVTQDELLTGISGATENAVTDFCMIAGGTNYQGALTESTILLKKGRSDATKEIYFISDGAPGDGLEGLAEAELLKTVGLTFGYGKIKTTIVTIMLQGTDTVLENSIASRDPDGKPLHAQVDRADVLAQTLADLFTNKIVQARVRYRGRGTLDWISTDLMAKLEKNSFELPPVEIRGDQFFNGLEIEFSYHDHLNQLYLNEAGIKWKAKDFNPHASGVYEFEKDFLMME